MGLYIEFIMIMMIGIANLIILLVMWVYLSREFRVMKFRYKSLDDKLEQLQKEIGEEKDGK